MTFDGHSVEATDTVVNRSRIEATHVGEFLGPRRHRAAGRLGLARPRLVKDGRVVGQWAQPDLWGIYQQLTAPH